MFPLVVLFLLPVVDAGRTLVGGFFGSSVVGLPHDCRSASGSWRFAETASEQREEIFVPRGHCPEDVAVAYVDYELLAVRNVPNVTKIVHVTSDEFDWERPKRFFHESWCAVNEAIYREVRELALGKRGRVVYERIKYEDGVRKLRAATGISTATYDPPPRTCTKKRRLKRITRCSVRFGYDEGYAKC